MITKEQALEALNKTRNPTLPVAYGTLRQHIEETDDLRRQLAEAQARLAELDGERYEQLEREHLGDAEKQTGIYFTSPADQKDAALGPDGWKLVPIEPTPEMVEVTFTSGAGEATRRVQRQHRANLYAKMLAAAPDAEMLTASPGGANNYHDAYRGARDEMYCWKRRALEAEKINLRLCDALNHKNGPTFMGEPALSVTPPDSPAHRAAKVLMEALERLLDSCEECTDFDGFTAQMVSMDDYHEAQDSLATAKQIMERGSDGNNHYS